MFQLDFIYRKQLE